MAEPERANRKVSRDTLLDAAARIFLERGYEATSIDAIIERTGGSKRNIYSAFGNKEGLFTAIVARHVDTALSALAIDADVERDLPGLLTAFGRQLLDILLSPDLVGIYRIVVTEYSRFPDLVRLFYEQGPGRASARLAELLEDARDRGEIDAADCARTADQYFGMIRGNLHLQVVLGLRPRPDAGEIEEIVTSATSIFLEGLRPGRG